MLVYQTVPPKLIITGFEHCSHAVLVSTLPLFLVPSSSNTKISRLNPGCTQAPRGLSISNLWPEFSICSLKLETSGALRLHPAPDELRKVHVFGIFSPMNAHTKISLYTFACTFVCISNYIYIYIHIGIDRHNEWISQTSRRVLLPSGSLYNAPMASCLACSSSW